MKSEKKMEAKSKKLFGITAGLFLFFTVFTLMVLLVDVQPIGPEESKVGLATINQSVFECFGVNFLCYEITEWLGMIAVLFALGFAVLGLVQLVKRKNLWEVDYEIILLGMFYILVAVSYLFFRKLFADKKPLRMALNTVSTAIILTTVIGRFLSGVHWFTDIIAGVLLSSALVMLYYSFVIYIDEKQKEKEGSVAEERADIVK